MKKTASMSDKLLFTAGRNELLPDSHCDLMTANALAIYAGETINNSGPCRFEAAGSPDDLPKKRSYAWSRHPDHTDDR